MAKATAVYTFVAMERLRETYLVTTNGNGKVISPCMRDHSPILFY